MGTHAIAKAKTNMFSKILIASTLATTAAFVAPACTTSSSALQAAPVTEWAGVTGPFGFFDPIGLSKDLDDGRLAFYREAEIKHGRVAMLAATGFLVQEHVTFTGIDSPSYVSFEQPGLSGGLWFFLALLLGNLEGKSVETFMPLDGGIVAEQNESRLFRIKAEHAAGDLGFDPLGLKPTNEKDLKSMQSKEINNGRLAMIGIAGMVAQELVSGLKI